MRQTHHRACQRCEATRCLRIEAENDRIVSINWDRDDPLSRGHICPICRGPRTPVYPVTK